RRGRSVVVARSAPDDSLGAGQVGQGRRRVVGGQLHRLVRHRRARRGIPECAQQEPAIRSRRGEQGGHGGAAASAPRPRLSDFPRPRLGAVRLTGRSDVASLTGILEDLGRATLQFLAGIGHAAMLCAESLWFALTGWRRGQPVRLAAVLEQMRQIGADALPIAALLAFVIGVMLGIQFVAALSEFGAQSQVVVAVAKSVTREFGALITAILVA